MKTLGAILIIASGLCLGLSFSAALHRRENTLLDLRQMLQSFKAGIGCTASPLSLLVAQNSGSRFCTLARAEPQFSTNPKSALLSSGEKLLKNQDDLKLYTDFVNGLGETDTQAQLEHIELYAQLLQVSITAAANDCKSKSRLYTYMGLFGGISLCLVLI